MKKTQKIDVDVDVEVGTSTMGEGFAYKHPSYGNAALCRTSGGQRSLFGSDLKHSNTIRLEIGENQCSQNLGKNWYYSNKLIVEVEFSATQFAELLTNMNTTGVPCTIRYRADMGHIVFKDLPKEIEYVEEVIEKKKAKQADKLAKTFSEISQILNQKGTVKKTDKEKVIKLANQLVSLSSDSLPFYAESAEKIINKAKSEAKAEVEAHKQHILTTLGYEVLQNPALLQKLLEDNSK